MNSYKNENALTKLKGKCGEDDICTIKSPSQSHIQWNEHFHKNPLYFRVNADFEADNEIDYSSIGNKTTII